MQAKAQLQVLDRPFVMSRSIPGRRQPRHRPGGLFLKGPLPWDWISRAAKLPGKSLGVGIVLWLLSGLKREREITLDRKSVV